ncbi:MAG TPA: undecaprenyldiphospho-muramoylpentapeptide beta-N-acetylglucosaminyltransferase [Candidatus Dormibacteraeota bacterium]|nr:undecaprenyldiphospho-muramoylpentapeptide beta-N-acetylglucosaminyltransferase [Candidatus Dormibacteraeota bacterium]
MRILFAGGGTGGHLYPAIAIADALVQRDGDAAQVVFVGTKDRLERRIVPQAGYRLLSIAARPMQRRSKSALLGTMLINARGVLQSFRFLLRERPEIIVATGGYVCFPLVLAARMLNGVGLLRARIALLEPNAHPGLTNRLLAPIVDEIWGSFPQADVHFAGRYVHTGVPIRKELRALPSRAEAIARLGLDPHRRTLLAMGGSQGARSLNDALLGVLEKGALPPGWQVLHLTGEGEYDRVRARAAGAASQGLRAYLDDPADAYAVADLLLARAGASTLAELVALGLPAILVPYPHAAEDHQRANALAIERAGGALLLEDRTLDADALAAALARSCPPERLAAMRASVATLRGPEPIETILARIAALVGRI